MKAMNISAGFPLTNGLDLHSSKAAGQLTGVDYPLAENGLVQGYGPHPAANERLTGISLFGWPSTAKHPHHQPCAILTAVPPSVQLVQDFSVQVRCKQASGGGFQREVPHFTMCPRDDGVYAVADWQDILNGSNGPLVSCQWAPCSTDVAAVDQEEAEDTEDLLDGGCDDSDIAYFQGFRRSCDPVIFGLFSAAHYAFPLVNIHDKLILNGLLTILCSTKPTSMQSLMPQLHPTFLMAVRSIIARNCQEGTSPATYTWAAIQEIDDYFDPPADSEDEDALLVGGCSFANGLELHCSKTAGQLTEGIDYPLVAHGLVQGYGPHPAADERLTGISLFGWPSTAKHPHHQPCAILTAVPPSVQLVQDFSVQVRCKQASGGSIQREVPHFTMCPRDDGVHTVADWQDILNGSNGPLVSCQWAPCSTNAAAVDQEEAEDTEDLLDGGCDDSDIAYFQGFRRSCDPVIFGLFSAAHYAFPLVNIHDKLILNGLLTILCSTKPISLQDLMPSLHPTFLRAVRNIIATNDHQGTSASTVTWAAIQEIDDFLDPPVDSEEEVVPTPAITVLPEYFYVVTGTVKNLDRAAEKDFAMYRARALQRELRKHLLYSADVFVAPSSAIEFVIFSSDSEDAIAEKLPQCIEVDGHLVCLGELRSDCDLELDDDCHGRLLNGEQVVHPAGTNTVLIGVAENESVAVLTNKQCRERLKAATLQCSGLRADGQRCANRRRALAAGLHEGAVLCLYHGGQATK